MRNHLRVDPSRTTLLRRQFMADVRRRFVELRKKLWNLIVVEDAFGLRARSRLEVNITANERWRFLTDDRKLESFNAWFQEQVDQGVLEVDRSPPWSSRYVQSAYRKGVMRTYADVNKVPALAAESGFVDGTMGQFLNAAFGQPESLSKLRLLSTRTFDQLKGMTGAMAQNLSRELAQGIADGRNPREIARRVGKTLDISRARALTIARTEIIHAHAEGQLDSFEQLGVEEVGVMAEWSTAGDDLVCPLCASLEGAVMKVKEARGLLPRHPNCRCAYIPADVGETRKGRDRRKEEAATQLALRKSVQAEFPNRPLEEAVQRSRWPAADRIKLPVRAQARIAVPPTAPPKPLHTSVDAYNQEIHRLARKNLTNPWTEKEAETYRRLIRERNTLKEAGQRTIPTSQPAPRLREVRPPEQGPVPAGEPIPARPPTAKPPEPSTVPRFSSVKEADDYMRREFKTSVGVTEGVKSDRAVKVFQETADTMHDMRTRYTRVDKYFKKDQVTEVFELHKKVPTLSDGKAVMGTYSRNERMLRLKSSLRLGGNKRPALKDWNVGSDAKSVFRHEFGHRFWHQDLHSSLRVQWNKMAKEFVGPNAPVRVSQYATTNASELFAESFAAYTHPNYVQGSMPTVIEDFMRILLGG